MAEETKKAKRIVLIGYPGSGKTMLAIGLYNGSRRKGVSITVTDSHARDKLAAYTSNIDANKEFPVRTTVPVPVNGQMQDQSERTAYPFEIVGWRGEKFFFEIEDYAGERASNPDYEKGFINDIVAKEPFGAVLLLNPGMMVFKEPRDPNNCDKRVFKLKSSLPKSYTSLIEKLCEVGCKHFVLAVTASDRISKGGDLFQTEQHENFKTVLREIRDYLKSRLSVENKKIKGKKSKDDCRLDYTVVYVTVTGRLKYDETGKAQEVHLAKGSANTAADPFLWIIDPWRMRFRNLVKRLMWIVPSSLLLLASMYVGAHVWNGYKIKNCLDQAKSVLAEFGDPEAHNFDNEKGSNRLVAAENHLKNVNERKWFVADKDMHEIDECLPTLLGTLMSNQVWLAYKKNSTVDQSDYNDPHMTLEGQPEFELWPYWEHSTRGKASYEAAKAFRGKMTMKLSTRVLESNVKYLIKKFGIVNDCGKQNDDHIKSLFEYTHSCSNDMVVAGNTNDLGNLISLRDICLNKWKKDVYDGISKNGVEEAEKRISLVITKDTGLDVAVVRESIFALNRVAKLRDFKSKATTCKQKVLDGDRNLQTVAAALFDYLIEAAESPYKWIVLDAAQRRFNVAVSTMLSSEDNRKELFDQMFHATRKLRNLDEKVFNEECLGDNVLYWLAATITNENGIAYQDSTDWLRYNFRCDAVAVRTDHAANNPGSKTFDKKVDARLNLSFEPQKKGYPKDIGGGFLINYEKDGEREDLWFLIPKSRVDVDMGAMDVLRIKVGEGKEDWKVNAPIPEKTLEFWPGWNENEKNFSYEYLSKFTQQGKKGIYPNGVLYWVGLWNVSKESTPWVVFNDALEKANSRKGTISVKREREVLEADNFLKNQGNNGYE